MKSKFEENYLASVRARAIRIAKVFEGCREITKDLVSDILDLDDEIIASMLAEVGYPLDEEMRELLVGDHDCLVGLTATMIKRNKSTTVDIDKEWIQEMILTHSQLCIEKEQERLWSLERGVLPKD